MGVGSLVLVAGAPLMQLEPTDLAAVRTRSQDLTKHEELAASFVSLVEMGVTGQISDDTAGRCNPKDPECRSHMPLDRKARATGNDWPPYGQTMVGQARLHNIRQCLQQVKADNVEGDFVEMGVWRGGACIYAKAVIDAMLGEPKRHVHLLDAFGYVKDYEGLWHRGPNSFLAVPVEQVKNNFKKYSLLDERVQFHAGLFNDSVTPFAASMRRLSRKIAVLRMDCNFYNAYRDTLYELYDLVPQGGFIIFDDGRQTEPSVAIRDFLREQRLPDVLVNIDQNSNFLRKESAQKVDWTKKTEHHKKG